MKEEIREALLKARPGLSDSTQRTYVSLLGTMASRIAGDDGMKVFDDVERVMKYIDERPAKQSQKTLLSALWVMTGNEAYRDRMMSTISEVNQDYSQRRHDEKRAAKAISFDQVRAIVDRLRQEHEGDLKNKDKMQRYALAAVVSGVYVPPRRLLDYSAMKIKDVDKRSDNFVVGNRLVFNQYKTAKLHGTQVVEMPDQLKVLLNKLRRAQGEAEYLFTDRRGQQLTSSAMNKQLTATFGFSVDMLRSIYLSDHVYDDNLLRRLEGVAQAMGNTVGSQMKYYVKDGGRLTGGDDPIN